MKRFYLVGMLIIIAVSFPIILWFLQPDKNLQVAIIDKTVPDETFREHLGITWLLNHLKFTDEKTNELDASSNYFGFQPDQGKESYEIRPLPADYDKYDAIYIADTYGVYEGDLPWVEKSREGSRSERIYGGLEEKEWKAITDRLNQKKKSLLIAEFNTFASPTSESVRESVLDYLGIDWSGWTGRYFDELDSQKNTEIPQWILEEFGDSWNYSGPGVILVNDIDYEVVVLEKEKHLHKEGISLSLTKEGTKQFGFKDSPDYKYWFDIVTPKQGTTVLANYEWGLTENGKKLLEQHGIPAQFAAVSKNEHGLSSSYYFAGDFNDVASVPRFYQMKGLQQIYKVAQKYSDEAFFWSTYLPMMKSILEKFEESPKTKQTKGSNKLEYNARVKDDVFEIKKNNEWVPITIKGVNIGMGKPGTFPGEAAITEEEYYRWFEHIGKMNANTIRVYTLHPPGFYNALKRYNDHHEEKIYVFHGVWINEEKLEESLDAFEEKNLRDFQDEMKTIVDVVHGNKIVEQKPGHASGVYRSDVSEYVIGWILGIEWYPFMVEGTNEKHSNLGDYNGKYFETKNAEAFEYWLAEQMEFITQYEVDHYKWMRPMSFTNWVTTDILEHPSDSTGQEDLVSVDPNVIYAKNEAELTNQFASYHIYPYYPDFLNYDQKYQTYVDHRGKKNNYAGYLNELHNAHRLPILVAEFGVPSSRGLTHENPFGWNQGFLSEKQQGDIIQHLFEDIMEEKLLGGLIFTWQDEWFKRTWNTMDYDNPDRRPFWSNAQTNEEQFGLLSFDRHKIQVDGKVDEWEKEPLYQKDKGNMKALYVDHDERYLYIRLDYDQGRKGYPLFLLDVVPEQGNTFVEGKDNLQFTNGVDFIIDLNKKESRIKIDSYYDFYTYLYGHKLKLIETKGSPAKNSGEFSMIKYALNKEYYLPDRDIIIPFSSYETGKLKEGNGNPASDEYDSLADYYVNDEGIIELRIPWLLIQSKDPSQKEFMGDIYKDGDAASAFIDQINIGALYFDEKGDIQDSFPSIEKLQLTELKGYTWENWNAPEFKERLKQSYSIVQDLFSKY
ncbi:glycosyl transferase family protein [Bacillus freudenreichii]|nr:glycosyl transferase family protein [Bacillus freudenreichii]